MPSSSQQQPVRRTPVRGVEAPEARIGGVAGRWIREMRRKTLVAKGGEPVRVGIPW